MEEEIRHICRDLNKRSPGSDGEREAAGYLSGILKKECACKDVITEHFWVHPSSFYGYCRISCILDILTCIGYFIHPSVSLIFGAITLLMFLLFFVFYLPIIDRLFPKKESVNVTAVRSCSGDLKRRLFLCGHIDAAWEFTLNYRFNGIVFEVPNAMALIGVLFYLAISVCALCSAGSWTQIAALCGIIFLPFFTATGFTYNPKQVVDGANDNLTGCFMGISLLRELEKHGISLVNTEIGVILTGSEEAGLRGAKEWCRKHYDEYRDVPTFILCFDTIHDPRFLMVNERDLNSTVRADRQLSGAFLHAAENAGVPCLRGCVPLFGGATDSAAFLQGGFRSLGITGLNHRLEDYYHTRRDTWNNLNRKGLENCYRATIELVEIVDAGGLDN